MGPAQATTPCSGTKKARAPYVERGPKMHVRLKTPDAEISIRCRTKTENRASRVWLQDHVAVPTPPPPLSVTHTVSRSDISGQPQELPASKMFCASALVGHKVTTATRPTAMFHTTKFAFSMSFGVKLLQKKDDCPLTFKVRQSDDPGSYSGNTSNHSRFFRNSGVAQNA